MTIDEKINNSIHTALIFETLKRLKLYNPEFLTITFFGTGIDLTGKGYSGTLSVDNVHMGKLTEIRAIGGLPLGLHTVEVKK